MKLPAKLAFLRIDVIKGAATANYSLNPTGEMNAQSWARINSFVEDQINLFLQSKGIHIAQQ